MTRPFFARVRLVTSAPAVDTRTLALEFPTVRIERAHAARVDDAVVDAEQWRSSNKFDAFDDAVVSARGDALIVRGDRHVELVACEVLARYQRFIQRRNAYSRAPIFDAVLRAHRALHDQSKPLVKADFDHAIDTWQWILRLQPGASFAVQVAALFHDVERLESEADARVEQHAPDYQAFKDAHASRGGERTLEILRDAGVDASVAARAAEIVATHERRGKSADIDLLNDADALSFFSLNCSGYIDYFGPEQTRRKLAYTLARMSDLARTKLALVRIRPNVRALLQRPVAV
jgi:hypothetical protein